MPILPSMSEWKPQIFEEDRIKCQHHSKNELLMSSISLREKKIYMILGNTHSHMHACTHIQHMSKDSYTHMHKLIHTCTQVSTHELHTAVTMNMHPSWCSCSFPSAGKSLCTCLRLNASASAATSCLVRRALQQLHLFLSLSCFYWKRVVFQTMYSDDSFLSPNPPSDLVRVWY